MQSYMVGLWRASEEIVLPEGIMSDGGKATEVKGILKKKEGQTVSVEDMNEAIREQGGNAMDGLEAQNVVDPRNDVDRGLRVRASKAR